MESIETWMIILGLMLFLPPSIIFWINETSDGDFKLDKDDERSDAKWNLIYFSVTIWTLIVLIIPAYIFYAGSINEEQNFNLIHFIGYYILSSIVILVGGFFLIGPIVGNIGIPLILLFKYLIKGIIEAYKEVKNSISILYRRK